MKKIHFLKLSACLVSAFALSGCSLEPLDDDWQKELFTRNFVKDFGLIDPNQDWNMAQSAVVTVNVGATPTRVKIYADYGDKYYLVADLEDASGVLKVPVDVPKTSRNVLVKVNGMKFYSQLGKTVDCTNMSRGVPEANYDTNGTVTSSVNTNPAVYEKTKGIYGITVKHTTSGNGNAHGFSDGGVYKYFNTEQMSALVSPTPWHEYWSLNLDNWSGPNSDREIGLIPESGVYNRTQEQLTTWVDAKIAQNHSMTYDFTIDTGDDGSFTIFPYYYGTNLAHEVGVYLIDNQGNPIINGGGTYNPGIEAINQFVSFPIFRDRQAGDLQIQPHFDSAIKEICLATGFNSDSKQPTGRITSDNKLTLYTNDKVNLSDMTYIRREVNGTSTWMSYRDYMTNTTYGSNGKTLGDMYIGRPAYHIWVKDEANAVTRAICEEERTEHGVIWYGIGKVIGDDEIGGQVSIATGIVQDNVYSNDTYNTGKSHFTGVKDAFRYKVERKAKASPVKSITLTLPSNMLDSNGSLLLHYASDNDRQTFDITTSMIECLDDDDQVMSVDDYWDEIDFNGWYDEYFYTTKDDNNHKFTITPKKATPAPASGETYNSIWPRIFADYNFSTVGYDDSDAKADFNLVIRDRNTYTNHSASATYTSWPSGVNASDYVKTASADEVVIAVAPTWCKVYNYDVTSDNVAILNSNGIGVALQNGQLTEIEIVDGTTAEPSTMTSSPGTVARINHWNDPAGTTTQISYYTWFKPSEYGKVLNAGDKIRFTLSQDDNIELAIYKPVTSTTGYSWINSKSYAETALANIYRSVEKTCVDGDGSKSTQASNLNVTVNITDQYPVDESSTVNHTVKWSWSDVTYFLPESQRNAPQRHGVKGKTNSRASGGKPALLEYDGNIGWYDANHIWSRFMPLREEVASYPPNNTVLARSRGYDITVTVNGQPYVGRLGLYMKVLGEYTVNDDTGGPKEYIAYTDPSSVTERRDGKTYYVYSQRRYNRDKDGALYDQISAMAVKHPVTKNTYLTFEDMLVDQSNATNKKGSDRDVNDLVFFVTNYKSIDGEKGSISEQEEYDEGFPWIWALEDLGSTEDFDFNDLVVRVSSLTVKNKTVGSGENATTTYTGLYRKVTFTPLAAGGILPIYICFHYTDASNNAHDYYLRPGDYNLTGNAELTVNNVTFGNLSDLMAPNESVGEAHRWFANGQYSNSSMLNTGFGPGGLKGKSCTLYVPCPDIDSATGVANPATGFQMNFFSGGHVVVDNSTMTVHANYFYAMVDGNSNQGALDADGGYKILNTELGAAPQSFVIMGDNWRWPKEKSHILKAYKGFKDWVTNKDAGNRWFENPTNTSELY